VGAGISEVGALRPIGPRGWDGRIEQRGVLGRPTRTTGPTRRCLGYQSGFLYRWSHTPLIPEIALRHQVRLEPRELRLGRHRIGWSSLKLSYGESEGVDEGGNPTGLV
jgi:hypothetical protein